MSVLMNYDKYDTKFSEFIRQRDADEYGMVRCITCGFRLHWESAHCGHYVGRANKATRFDPDNCNAQCPVCNSQDDKKLYRQKLIEKIGLLRVEQLESKPHKHWTEWELDEYIKEITKTQ